MQTALGTTPAESGELFIGGKGEQETILHADAGRDGHLGLDG